MAGDKQNIHLIVKQHEGGFFSNFNKIITFLNDCTDRVVKITWQLKGQTYGAFAYNCDEVYGNLFKEYNTGERIDKIVNLEKYTHEKYTGRNVHTQYTSPDLTWRQRLYSILNYIQPTPTLTEAIAKIDNNPLFKSKVIGILKRNELLKCEQVNNKMPTIQDYYNEIDKIIDDNTHLFLSVDNISDLNAFITRYKKCIYNTKMRRTIYNTDTEPHFQPGSIDDALHTYIDVYTLSKCSHFIHPLSNMSTAALYFNPNLISIYI